MIERLLRRRKASWGSDLVYGALGGAVGAACMTPLRIAARRAGLIDKMLPQVIEESLAHRLGARSSSPPERHHVADQLLHLAYGSAQGAVYGLLPSRLRGSVGVGGALFGALVWAVNGATVIPLLGATRPIWRLRATENLVSLGAHVVYGVVTALLTDELARQRHHRPTPDLLRRLTPVG
jgi:hypothetical protein